MGDLFSLGLDQEESLDSVLNWKVLVVLLDYSLSDFRSGHIGLEDWKEHHYSFSDFSLSFSLGFNWNVESWNWSWLGENWSLKFSFLLGLGGDNFLSGGKLLSLSFFFFESPLLTFDFLRSLLFSLQSLLSFSFCNAVGNLGLLLSHLLFEVLLEVWVFSLDSFDGLVNFSLDWSTTLLQDLAKHLWVMLQRLESLLDVVHHVSDFFFLIGDFRVVFSIMLERMHDLVHESKWTSSLVAVVSVTVRSTMVRTVVRFVVSVTVRSAVVRAMVAVVSVVLVTMSSVHHSSSVVLWNMFHPWLVSWDVVFTTAIIG